ncbi:MAG: amidohydrolase, partial [Oscillospiraceae bacterium]
AFIAQTLRAIGIEPQEHVGGNGVVGLIEGARPGKCIALRADIDALPVLEKTGLPFASEIDGKMHACGHDCHIAIQLGAAKILSSMREELAGTVRFFFQTGEEVAQGAKLGVENGVMDGVDACLGMHIWGQVDAPRFNIEAGPRMASCDSFTVTVRGTSAHGSAPQFGRDAIVAASAVIMNLQQLVSRVNSPLNPLVLSIGTMNGGQRFNIIADKVEMGGTVRTFDRDFRMEMEGRIREICELTAKAYGCTAELSYQYLTGPVINDSTELVALAQKAAVSLYGEDALVGLEKMTGSEDFAFLMEKAPAIYGFLGARSEKVAGSGLPNHHECFTVDEESLGRGAAIAAQFAADFLAK